MKREKSLASTERARLDRSTMLMERAAYAK